jgi:multidrug efflux pump
LATVNAPDGSTLEYTDRYARSLEKFGQAYPEFDRIFANMGNPTVGQGTVVYRAVDWDERKRTTLEIARELGGKFNSLPGVNAFPITPPSLGQGFRERPLNFVIQTSDSYQNLNLLTRQMMDEIAKVENSLPPYCLGINKPIKPCCLMASRTASGTLRVIPIW